MIYLHLIKPEPEWCSCLVNLPETGWNKTINPALTSELRSGGAVWGGLPAVLVLFKLLHPAHVETPVPLGHIQDQQVKDLPLLHHRQLEFRPWETFCVVAIETGLPHVNAGDEEFILWTVCARWQESPFHHGQSSITTPLGHNTGQRDVLTLLGDCEGGRGDGDVDSQTQIWRRNNNFIRTFVDFKGSVMKCQRCWCQLCLNKTHVTLNPCFSLVLTA